VQQIASVHGRCSRQLHGVITVNNAHERRDLIYTYTYLSFSQSITFRCSHLELEFSHYKRRSVISVTIEPNGPLRCNDVAYRKLPLGRVKVYCYETLPSCLCLCVVAVKRPLIPCVVYSFLQFGDAPWHLLACM